MALQTQQRRRDDALDLAFSLGKCGILHGVVLPHSGLFRALSVGVALAIGNYLLDGGAWNDFVYRWFGIYESLLCVFLSFGLLWLFRKFVNQTNAFQTWCAQQAYGAYIVHLFVLLAVQNATDGLLLPGIVKFFLIATIASILSFLLTYLLRLIPGVKRVL